MWLFEGLYFRASNLVVAAVNRVADTRPSISLLDWILRTAGPSKIRLVTISSRASPAAIYHPLVSLGENEVCPKFMELGNLLHMSKRARSGVRCDSWMLFHSYDQEASSIHRWTRRLQGVNKRYPIERSSSAPRQLPNAASYDVGLYV